VNNFSTTFLLLPSMLLRVVSTTGDLADDELHKLAQTHFSISRLTEAQLEAVKRAVRGENVFVFTPTASGKTMCFYLVPFVLKKLRPAGNFGVIVISPLIALMKDQVAFLNQKGHHAVYLCGDTKAVVLPTLAETKDLFLFTTPEQAVAEDVKKVLVKQKNAWSLVVVDEGHCVLDGCPEYRPEYAQLTRLLGSLESPIMALTATPTYNVRNNLPIKLGVGKYAIVEGILDRPELFLEVRKVNGLVKLDSTLLEEISKKTELTMIFCQNKTKLVELYTDADQVMGKKVGIYHASLSEEQKTLVLGRIMRGELTAVFATSALGMGVNIPGLRWVILFGPPTNPLDLAQQLGRASRDKKPGKATLVVSNRASPKAVPTATRKAAPKYTQVSLCSSFSLNLSPHKPLKVKPAPTAKRATAAKRTTAAKPVARVASAVVPAAPATPATPATPAMPAMPPLVTLTASAKAVATPSSSSQFKRVMMFAQPQGPVKTLTVKEADATHSFRVPVDDAADKAMVEQYAHENVCKRKLLLG